MKFNFGAMGLAEVPADVLVYFVSQSESIKDKELNALDKAVSGAISELYANEEFVGKNGQTAVFYNPAGYKAGRVILLGVGDKKDLCPDSFRKAVGTLSKNKVFHAVKKAAFHFDGFENDTFSQAAIEGYLLGSYSLLDYKTGDDAISGNKITEIGFYVANSRLVKKLEKAVETGSIIAEGQNLVRTLGSTPSNFLTPKMFAGEAQKLAKKYKFSCKVLDEKEIAKEKMGAYLSVARGSDEPPRFIILEYKGGPAKQDPIVLVGKGVTFDSGGISLKPGLNMHEMKGDMTGAAVVVSSIVTAARLGLARNIVGLIPTTENMPSGKATKPGDIVTSRKGKTIEIINTDAEGRLVLADALDYANKYKPQAVIDIATLTGATLFILGYSGAPIMGNNDKLLERIKEASANTAELVWPLPIWDDHRNQMKSPIADLVNSGGRPAGTICAAAFLENFIGDYPWAHIDIAYVDIEPAGKPYIPKGNTGIGMRLLVDLLINWKKL